MDDPYLGQFYARLELRKNHQIAIVVTARKLLVPIFFMLRCEEVYVLPGMESCGPPVMIERSSTSSLSSTVLMFSLYDLAEFITD